MRASIIAGVDAPQGNIGSDSARLAAGSEAVDCSKSWYRKLARLEENSGAAAVELTDLREIDSAASKITVQGARYPEHLEHMTGR